MELFEFMVSCRLKENEVKSNFKLFRKHNTMDEELASIVITNFKTIFKARFKNNIGYKNKILEFFSNDSNNINRKIFKKYKVKDYDELLETFMYISMDTTNILNYIKINMENLKSDFKLNKEDINYIENGFTSSEVVIKTLESLYHNLESIENRGLVIENCGKIQKEETKEELHKTFNFIKEKEESEINKTYNFIRRKDND